MAPDSSQRDHSNRRNIPHYQLNVRTIQHLLAEYTRAQRKPCPVTLSSHHPVSVPGARVHYLPGVVEPVRIN